MVIDPTNASSKPVWLLVYHKASSRDLWMSWFLLLLRSNCISFPAEFLFPSSSFKKLSIFPISFRHTHTARREQQEFYQCSQTGSRRKGPWQLDLFLFLPPVKSFHKVLLCIFIGSTPNVSEGDYQVYTRPGSRNTWLMVCCCARVTRSAYVVLSY